jgi:hypothetical protein
MVNWCVYLSLAAFAVYWSLLFPFPAKRITPIEHEYGGSIWVTN